MNSSPGHAQPPSAAAPAPAGNRDTPAMRQHARFKAEHPDCLLLFRLGDFYELFFDDALVAHRALGITLTERTTGIPMAGVPHHAAEPYIRRLVDMGHRVAVCEQLQDPKDAKGIVDRGVVRVITPGTRLDESLLDDRCANRLAAVAVQGATAGVAAVEVSTGVFTVSEVPAAELADELARLGAAELLVAEAETDDARATARLLAEQSGAALTERPGWFFRAADAAEALRTHYGIATLDALGLGASAAATCAAGALLRYLVLSQGTTAGALGHLSRPQLERPTDRLILDAASLRALEVERTLRTGSAEGSLLGSLNACRTGAGRRLLRDWLCAPLADLAAITERHDCVGALLSDETLCSTLRAALDRVQDMARIASRAATARATPRDLAALVRSVGAIDSLAQALAGGGALDRFAQALTAPLSSLSPLAARLGHAISDPSPAHARDGGILRDGFDAELDEVRLLQRDSNAWLAEYQRQLVQSTGIDSLKVGFNRVFGYYIEVSQANAARMDERFQRKQTLRNAERYETPELKAFEARVLTAEARAIEREKVLFAALVGEVAAQAPALCAAAQAASALDCLQCFATCARRGRWCRPTMLSEPVLRLRDARHPVLEGMLRESFVPNDCTLGPGGATLALVTGPNMAGKSTFIRQCALIALLAHAGSWVPAAAAEVGCCDRILTRLGSADELHQGQSTFMVEMVETAAILHQATARSMVILDEVGRGTGTLDGLSLAWAIAEALEARGCRTLFATHYHEITALGDGSTRVANLHVAVREWNDRIVFLHRIEPGGTDKSYGIHVAQLAGVPPETVARAREILRGLSVQQAHASPASPVTKAQLELFREYLPHPVIAELRAMPLDEMTPLQAFDAMRRLADQARRPD